MSSHHAVKFFINHYTQVAESRERKLLKEQIRQLKKEEDTLKWADYRRQRAVVKAAAEYIYWSEAGYFIATLLTVVAIVLYGLRNV